MTDNTDLAKTDGEPQSEHVAITPIKDKHKQTMPPQVHEAYEIYRKLGRERSIQKVADKVGKAKSTVQKYSVNYGWMRRMKMEALANAEVFNNQHQQAYNDTYERIKDSETEFLDVLETLLTNAQEKILEGKININNVTDLRKIAEIYHPFANAVLGRIRPNRDSGLDHLMSIYDPTASPQDLMEEQLIQLYHFQTELQQTYKDSLPSDKGAIMKQILDLQEAIVQKALQIEAIKSMEEGNTGDLSDKSPKELQEYLDALELDGVIDVDAEMVD